jgi:phage-related minor tail protein
VAEYNTRLLETKSALSLFEDQHRSAIKALKSANDNMGESVVSAGQARAGYQNLGRQMQDVATQLTGGANIGTIISQQGGQVADALAQMGGRFAGVAEFLAGPWGAAIIVGVGLLANLAEGFISAGDAADENATALASVKIGSDALSTIQTTLGNVFDLTTGKMKDQTSVAMGLAKASLLLAEAQANSAWPMRTVRSMMPTASN